MTPDDFLRTVLKPGIAWCQTVPGWKVPFDDRAQTLMLTIAGQESGLTDRVQFGSGAAHGFWQFERAGGVAGVLLNVFTHKLANAACEAYGIAPISQTAVWTRFASAGGDNLAVAFARLLLWSDAHALPALGDADAGWNYYLRNWRPGKPRPNDWPANYQAATNAIS